MKPWVHGSGEGPPGGGESPCREAPSCRSHRERFGMATARVRARARGVRVRVRVTPPLPPYPPR